MKLQPLDIVLVHGLWYNPSHWMIKWRSLDTCVHCFTLYDEFGNGYNPLFKGIEIAHISKYYNRDVTIVRYKNLPKGKTDTICNWLAVKFKISRKYDFFRQWLLGYVCGITAKPIANEEDAWTCSELPYWAFQENGVKLTSIDEALPLPRLFRYHNDFEIVFEGKLTP